MSTRIRALASVATLAAVTTIALPAGPALAAGSTTASLTAASCAAQSGSFNKAQGVKTCTIVSYRSESYSSFKTAYAPYDLSPETISNDGVSADGYEGDFTVTNLIKDTKVQTQKGGGSITTQQSSVVVQSQLSDTTCYAITIAPGGYNLDPTYTAPCYALGLFNA